MSCVFRIKDAFIFILLLTSFDSFSQIRGEFDLNPIYPGRRNKVIFNSGESSITKNLSIEENLFTSNNNKYACINKSVHKEDSLAEFEIFDTVGNSKIKIIAPNLDRGCVSDDGKLAVFGSFFSRSIRSESVV